MCSRRRSRNSASWMSWRAKLQKSWGRRSRKIEQRAEGWALPTLREDPVSQTWREERRQCRASHSDDRRCQQRMHRRLGIEAGFHHMAFIAPALPQAYAGLMQTLLRAARRAFAFHLFGDDFFHINVG